MNDTVVDTRAQELRQMYMNTEYASAIVLTVLSPISVLANVLLLVAVYRDPLKCLRKPVTYFIVNLSLADLICGLVVEPFFTFNYYARTASAGTELRELRGLAGELYNIGGRISMVTISSSFLLVLQLSIVQYMAITCPVKYRIFVTKTRVSLCVLATWTYFIGFGLVWAFADIEPLLIMKIHLALHATLISILLVIVQCLTFRAFRQRVSERLSIYQTEMDSSSGLELKAYDGKAKFIKRSSTLRKTRGPSRQRTTERQFTVMTFCLAAVVLFSALPHVIVFHVFLYKKPASYREEIFLNIAVRISDLLLFLKIAADPFIFAWRLPDYRQALLLAFKCKSYKPVRASWREPSNSDAV